MGVEWGRAAYISTPLSLDGCLLMCVCTGNGSEVKGQWEAGENIMESRPQSGRGRGERGRGRRRETAADAG